MDKVFLYTDGACSGNPGPGGYCAILKFGEHEKVISGAEKETTNNRMELSAVIEGLKALTRPCEVTVVSDSKYVCDAINQGWLRSWEKKNWKKADGKPVLNPLLWQELNSLLKIHKVSFEWIKGHAGHPFNERCDRIAVDEYKKLI
ncbi:MAG: ribonuclease HI [Ruminococcaceae bacterium]|nr:ribonuclease HI [Oscillospiraceae bacterium]